MTQLWRGHLVAALVALTCLACPPAQPAWSQDRSIRVETTKSTTPNGQEAVALVVNGKVVAQLAEDQRSRSPLRNISVAASLIAAAYRGQQADLTVQASDNSGGRYALFLNGRVLLVATDQEGKAWGAEPADLAQTWRQNLLDAWNLEPPLQVEEQALSAEASAGIVVKVPVDPAPSPAAGTLSQSSGVVRSDPTLANLIISDGHRVHDPPDHTRFDGDALAASLTAQITGSRPDASNARQSIEGALLGYAGLPVGGGLEWSVLNSSGSPLALSPGQRRSLEISYRSAGQSAASAARVSVLLEHRVLAVPRESLTFFSNVPEQVRDARLLYSAELPPRQAGRLIFHHQNRDGGPLKLVARVINTSGRPAALHVIPGLSRPDINTFYVGFKSAEVFWHNLNSGTGYVLQIPADGQASLAVQSMEPGYTASGYFKLSNLSDSALRLETLTLKPGSAVTALPWPDTEQASHSVYPAPYQITTASYEAGDPWMYLRLGEADPLSMTDHRILQGCYGMTHSFHVELHNPHHYPALVFAVLRASAGEVKGQFFIDDEYVVTPLVAGGEEQLLKEIPLKPGETRLLKIKAIPLNGGFYPASIILRESRYP